MTGGFYLKHARRAIEELFADTTVPKEQTLQDLCDLSEKIQEMIGAIRADIREEELGHSQARP